MGADYKTAPSAVAVDGGSLYTFVQKSLIELDRFTGEVIASSDKETANTAGYGIVPPTVGEDMIFMPLRKGSVAAFDRETLELLWETPQMGGQCNCDVVYEDGKIFFGTWVSETKDGYFCCYSVQRTGYELLWEVTKTGGFYRTQAFLENGYAVFGSDDGVEEKNQSPSATLFTVDIESGDIVSQIDEIEGDIRSSIVKYKDSYVFSTKAGYIYKVQGENISRAYLGGACSVTPVIEKETAYVGISTKSIAVVDLETMTVTETIPAVGNPNGGITIHGGRLYTTCNALPGGLYVLENGNLKEVFTPPEDLRQYCVSPVSFAEDGMIYYKNDSGNIFALKPYVSLKFGLENDENLWLIRDKSITSYAAKKGENTIKVDRFPAFLWRNNLQPIVQKIEI